MLHQTASLLTTKAAFDLPACSSMVAQPQQDYKHDCTASARSDCCPRREVRSPLAEVHDVKRCCHPYARLLILLSTMMCRRPMTKHAVLALSWMLWSGYLLLNGGTSSSLCQQSQAPSMETRSQATVIKLAASSHYTTACSSAMYPLLRDISGPTWAKHRLTCICKGQATSWQQQQPGAQSPALRQPALCQPALHPSSIETVRWTKEQV